MTGIEWVIETLLFKKQWDQCFHIHKYVWLPQGRCACLPSPAHKGDHTNTGLELRFPHEAASQVSWFVTQLSALPRLSFGPLTSGQVGQAEALPPAPVLLLGLMNLMRGSEVMARSAYQASWRDPRQWVHSVHRGQGAHCVRKHSSLLTDVYRAGWIQFLDSHFPWLLWPNSWGFEIRGSSTKLTALKNYPYTARWRNFKPQGHKLSKSQCDSNQIPERWLQLERARQTDLISSGPDWKCDAPIKTYLELRNPSWRQSLIISKGFQKLSLSMLILIRVATQVAIF